MKIYKHSTNESNLEDIQCMANMLGRKVTVPGPLPFSFFFSSKGNNTHSIRVKPVLNPNKMKESESSVLELHGDWKFIPNHKDKHVSNSLVDEIRKFFRQNFILFAAVWEGKLYESSVQEYLEGEINIHELVQDLDFYDEYADQLDQINSIEELEQFCRTSNLVGMYGN